MGKGEDPLFVRGGPSFGFPDARLRALLCQRPKFVDENGSHIDRGSRTKSWKPSYIRISALSGSVQNLLELCDLLKLDLNYLS